MAELRASIVQKRELWGWGTDSGLIPWGDRKGVAMIALWRSEARAREENEAARESGGEGPIRFSTEDLLARINKWKKAGIRVYALEPSGEDILYALRADEFRLFLETGRSTASKLP